MSNDCAKLKRPPNMEFGGATKRKASQLPTTPSAFLTRRKRNWRLDYHWSPVR